MLNLNFDKEDGTLQNFSKYAHMEKTSDDMRMPSNLQLVYMVPKNFTQLLNINTTKFQVERKPVYCTIIYF